MTVVGLFRHTVIFHPSIINNARFSVSPDEPMQTCWGEYLVFSHFGATFAWESKHGFSIDLIESNTLHIVTLK